MSTINLRPAKDLFMTVFLLQNLTSVCPYTNGLVHFTHEQRFLSAMGFNIYKVVRAGCQSRGWFYAVSKLH